MKILKKLSIFLLSFCIVFINVSLFVSCSEKEPLPIEFIRADSSTDGYATIIVPEDRPLKTLVLSDPQVATVETYTIVGNTTEKTYAFVEELVTSVSPDFVFITGDICINNIFTGFDLYVRYAEIFEKLNVYWAFCLGNHDSEKNYVSATSTKDSKLGQLTKTRLISELSSFPHCLATVGDCTDIYETAGNYFINVRNPEGKLIKSFVSFDCCYSKDGYNPLITDSQIEWYKENVNNLSDAEYGTNRNGKTVKTIAFSHVPIPELDVAVNSISLQDNNPDVTYLYGENLEEPYYNLASETDFFNSIYSMNSLEGMFFGHHHDNDINVIYKGVRLGFVQSTTFCSYYRIAFPKGKPSHNLLKPPALTVIDFTNIKKYGDMRGGTEIIIGCDGTFSATPVYAKDVIENYTAKYFSVDTYSAYCSKIGYTVVS